VDTASPLTDSQRAKLAALLAPAVEAIRRQRESLAYPVPAAADLLGTSERRMWELIGQGTIPSFVEAGRRLVSHRALEVYMASRDARDAVTGDPGERH
jgi:predicted DNA-binding transcriptional regulator AlpA